MTPLQLGILVHYYGCASDYRSGDFSAPAVREAIDWFKGEAELLKPTSSEERAECPCATYELTDKGRFFVEQLCAMPLPVMQWKIPETT